MKLQVLDTKGNKAGEVTLDESIFGIKPNLKVLAQYVRVFLSNQRQGTSKVKTRAEVSGGGVKPWRQKGTGRARHGSIRSPIWVHGGVAHGPLPKDWQLNMPKKMKVLAMKSVLSQKYAAGKIISIEEVPFEKPNTKKMIELLNNIEAGSKVLFVWQNQSNNMLKSLSNILGVKTAFAGSLNAYDVLNAGSLVFVKEALESLNKRYTHENK